ncbi:MAG TPA: hypothetical protein VK646_00755 [Actinomycetota bacterium]|nr:hypothetical protein [Actinomycetota bacterium]
MRTVLCACFVLTLALFAPACHRSTTTISGHYYREGGPAPGLPTPLPGTIHISGRGSVPAGSDGSFSVAVSPGTYTLTASSPHINGGKDPCGRPRTVTVRSGEHVTVNIFCIVP